MTGTPLILDTAVREKIAKLSALAQANPVDLRTLANQIKTPYGKALHMDQMSGQTIGIPMAYLVTFSIELGHPCGTCRHLSMSVHRDGRIPNEPAVWMVACEFGFWGRFELCSVWVENLLGHGHAINLVQPITPPPALDFYAKQQTSEKIR